MGIMDSVFLDNPLGYISCIYLIYFLYYLYWYNIHFCSKNGRICPKQEPEAIPGSWTLRLGCGSASKCGPNCGNFKLAALSSQLGYIL